MGKFGMRSIIILAALLAAVFAAGLATAAETKKSTTMQIPKGAVVQMESQSQMRLNNSGGQSGTFDCRCSGANASGSCVLGRGSTTIICGAGGSTCTGSCKLYTTTGGLTGGAMMKK